MRPDFPLFAGSERWEDVQAELEAAGIGDGLPLVPPTEAGVRRMLEGIDDPERSRGQVPPLFGDLVPAAAAYQCVLAGCRPGELPVVLAAVEACLDPAFNLLGLATTTGTAAVAVIVHGPVAGALGVNGGTNCLGPGVRANACIGRAVSLTLRNVGGARAGVGDMATMGQPGKYTFCFAEHADSPLPSLAARRGLAASASAVTVLGVSGTAEVLPAGAGGSADAILSPLAAAMRASLSTTCGHRTPDPGEQFLLLPPEIVATLSAHGLGLRDIQTRLSGPPAGDPAERPDPADVHPVVTGGPGVKMTYLPLWAGGTRSVTRALSR